MNSTESAPITVVVATYNHEAYIAETLNSIISQETDVPFHVLVHDDASTDGTPGILREFEREHPGKFTLVLQPQNLHSRGVSISWEMLQRAQGKYVAFCEGDDFWVDTKKLDKQFAFMEANDWCSISHHDVTVLNQTDDPSYAAAVEEMLTASERRVERTPGTLIAHGNFLMTCSVMLRRDSIRDEVVSCSGGFWPEDFIVFSAACENGDIGFVPDTEASYRLHGSNSWALLDTGVKESVYTSVYYYLAAHLDGRMREAARSALIERLFAEPLEQMPPALANYAMHVDRLEAGMTQIRSEIARARLERQAAVEASEGFAGQVAGLRATIRSLRKEIAGLRSSSSWRATAPMRRATLELKNRKRRSAVKAKVGSK